MHNYKASILTLTILSITSRVGNQMLAIRHYSVAIYHFIYKSTVSYLNCQLAFSLM